MRTHIVFKDVNPYVYEITEDCHIYKNGEEIPMDDIIYHSTNGYDYVLLEQNHLENEEPKMKLYRLEFIMVSSFNPGLQNKWEWFKVNHIDGDIKNCKLDNLSLEEDVEEWRVITWPDVKPNMYAVSSWGNVKNIRTNTVLHSFGDHGYRTIGLSSISVCCRHYFVHRLVAHEFIDNKYIGNIDVNHIDSTRSHNHYSNLEIVTRKKNLRHANIVGRLNITGENHPANKFTENEIRVVCKALVDFNGDIELTLKYVRDIGLIGFSRSNIERIKYKKNWKYISDTYFEEGQFIKQVFGESNKRSKLSNDIVTKICSLLVEYNGSIIDVCTIINRERANVTRSDIEHIKYKKNWRHISDKFFVRHDPLFTK